MVLSFDRPGRLKGRSELMLGILRLMIRGHEDVLAGCSKYPAVLEQNLKEHRRMRLMMWISMSLIIAWVLLDIILDINRESLWSLREDSNFVWFAMAWLVVFEKFNEHRIQSLRLIQALHSEE